MCDHCVMYVVGGTALEPSITNTEGFARWVLGLVRRRRQCDDVDRRTAHVATLTDAPYVCGRLGAVCTQKACIRRGT